MKMEKEIAPPPFGERVVQSRAERFSISPSLAARRDLDVEVVGLLSVVLRVVSQSRLPRKGSPFKKQRGDK